ncbi:MAG: FHA domain-containing protein [Anaerolineae bacterium]
MIECPSCGRKHRPGTLFCSECGVYLPTGGPLGTEPIPERDLPAAKAHAWGTDSEGDRGEQAGAVLRVKVRSTGRQIQLPSEEDVQLGRLDAAHGIFPDIDLTPDGGLEGGVSRRHCRIYEDDGEFFVEDLGSANGTFLDGERLTPYLPHALSDGEVLQLGRVELEIAIEL